MPAKILIADIKDEFLFTLKEKLEESKHEVVLTSNGEEAIATLKEQKDFNLALLGIEMPIINGMEVLKFIKERKVKKDLFSDPEIKTIMLSSKFYDLLNAIESKKLEANDLVSKPISFDDVSDILKVIERILEEDGE